MMIGTADVTLVSDLAYATESPVLALDLYRPESDADVPVVVYFHGGGWRLGDKSANGQGRLAALAAYGVAVASVNYRLLPERGYPEQIHDVKAAVRWLRAHGSEYGLAVERIGAWGASAGGYLASMLGVTNGQADFEGEVGQDQAHESDVAAVVAWFGASDLVAGLARSALETRVLAAAAEEEFLGGEGDKPLLERAREASPLFWVTPQAPPFLVVHGDRDRMVSIAHSEALHNELTRAGAQSTLVKIGGAGHEGEEFDRASNLAMTAAFLVSHLKGDSADS
jgi:acetyl esterase/lipase